METGDSKAPPISSWNGEQATWSSSMRLIPVGLETASSTWARRPRTSGRSFSRPNATCPTHSHALKSQAEIASLCQVPEHGDPMEFPSAQAHSQHSDDHRPRRAVTGSTPHYVGGHSLAIMDDEEEQWILDEELARQGMYRGSHRQLLCLYTLTPLFTLLIFVALAFLPSIAYPLSPDTTRAIPYPYPPYLPFPLPELLTATAFWGLSYLLSSPIFSITSFILSHFPILSLSLNSLLQSIASILLRQAVVPILLIPHYAVFDHPTWHDIAFRRVWWLSLGWAAAEAIVGIKQGYEGIALYRDALVSVRRVVSPPSGGPKPNSVLLSGYGAVRHGSSTRHEVPGRVSPDSDVERRPLLEREPSVASSVASRSDSQLKDAIEEEVERDIDELIALRGRAELEDLYGMPFIHIPVFISCLHRLNSVFFVLGSTLFFTAAYMRSSLSATPSPKILFPPPEFQSIKHEPWKRPQGNTQLLITFPLILILQCILTLLHTPRVLPRIGIQTFVYVGLLISLGVFFAGLGVWEGIV